MYARNTNTNLSKPLASQKSIGLTAAQVVAMTIVKSRTRNALKHIAIKNALNHLRKTMQLNNRNVQSRK